MIEFLWVLLIALLPAAGSLLGSGLAELTRTPKWMIGAALHAAAGVAIALISVDLTQRVLDGVAAWLLIVLFAAGAAFSVLLTRAAEWLSNEMPGGATAGAWRVYMATAADLWSDGLMTGAGSAVSSGLGLLLALSQVFANVPAGFATLSSFRSHNTSRAIRLMMAASLAIPVIVGAALGFSVLRGTGDAVKVAALAFIVGVLLLATIEDLVPEADKPGTKRTISTASFVGGFAFFTLLAQYVD